MRPEEYIRRTEEILETINCFISLEEEVLKLLCLFNSLDCKKLNGDEVFNKDYVIEKTAFLVNQIPLVLNVRARNLYVAIKINQEEEMHYVQSR